MSPWGSENYLSAVDNEYPMDSSNKLSEDFDLLKFGVGGYMDALEDISEPSGFMDSNTGGPSAGSSMSDMNSVYNNSKPCKPSNNHFYSSLFAG